jgi:hypothetical protein
MKPEPKPDESVAIQQNSDDVDLRIPYDINSARNTSFCKKFGMAFAIGFGLEGSLRFKQPKENRFWR